MKWDSVRSKSVMEGNGVKYNTLATHVMRLKTTATNPRPDEIVQFCHVEDFMQCYFFIMMYHCIVDNSTSDEECSFIFPSWESTIKIDGDTDSKVSQHFREQWKLIKSLAQKYVKKLKDLPDGESEELIAQFCLEALSEGSVKGAHAGKKRSIQQMGDSFSLPQDIIAHAGWVVKSFHSFFDYWNGTFVSMVRTGKALAGWVSGNTSTQFTCGKPPSLDDIITESDKVNGFVTSLLGHKVNLSNDVKNLLVANMLRFYQNFIDFLKKDPCQTYKSEESISSHAFVYRVSFVIFL